MDEAIQFLLTLQDYDMHLDELERNLKNFPKSIADSEADIGQWNQKIAQEKIQNQSIKLEIKGLEKEIEEIKEAVTASRHRLAFTRSPRELESLTKKIEDRTCKLEQMEEQLLVKMFEIDSKEADFSLLQQTSAEEIQKLSNEREYRQQLAIKLEKNKAEVRDKIAVMRKILQENHGHWLQHYDRTKRTIRKMPCVVGLELGNFCGGCHLKLSDYNSRTVDRNFPFMICESCARMILLTPFDECDDADEIDGDNVKNSTHAHCTYSRKYRENSR
jgi:predicted  nucleic acid-binding Zn-ribbon protein